MRKFQLNIEKSFTNAANSPAPSYFSERLAVTYQQLKSLIFFKLSFQYSGVRWRCPDRNVRLEGIENDKVR